VKLLLRLRRAFFSLPRWTLWLQPVVGGLTVGLLGYFVPQVLGVGYDQVDRVLGGDVVLKGALLLAALKIFATALCYASGNAGGIFGPSLFIGAMIGGAVGSVAERVVPGASAGPGAYALVGMGTAFAGIVRTPLTSVIMICETTRDYTIIVPLMISNMVAFWISQRLQHEPIYEALARQDGIHLPGGSFRQTARRLTASAAIREAPEPLPAQLSLRYALERIEGTALDAWPVSEGEAFLGMVGTHELAQAVRSGRGDDLLCEFLATAADGTGGTGAHVHLDQPLGQVLSRMGETRHSVLPVVSRANVQTLLGIVTLSEVLRAYGVERGERPKEAEAAAGGPS
jgi:CIC family chloride channel protein